MPLDPAMDDDTHYRLLRPLEADPERGMQALISALGLVEAERFLVAVSRDRFDYTEWRRTGLARNDHRGNIHGGKQACRVSESGQ